MKDLGSRIAQVRKSNGLSQEELAESAGINLRTVQRIESGETDPHGNTLRRICKILDIQVSEIYNFSNEENYNYIGAVHFSALSFLLFPLGNIILPLILWFVKKDQIIDLSYYSKKLLNFQLTWTIITYFQFVMMFFQSVLHVKLPLMSPLRGQYLILFIGIMYSVNLIYTIIAGLISLKGGKRNIYPIAIPFMRS